MLRPSRLFVILMTWHGLLGTLAFATGPGYQVQKLANGLDIVTMESHKVPLVTIVLCSKAGAMTESEDINGLTHLWEHMFFKGNQNLPNQEAFNRKIRQLGIVYNGDTSAEKVRYYFTLPSVNLVEGLKFMADAIMTPLLEEKELERERRVVLDEWDRNASSPGFDTHRLRLRMVYGQNAYRRDPLGIRPIIEKATREQLVRIKDEVFVPANSSILIAGDFDATEVKGLVSQYFGPWQNPTGWKPITPPPFKAFPPSEEVVMVKPEAQNLNYTVVWNGPKARTEQSESYAADVLVTLLNNRSGRFYKKYVDSGQTFSTGFGYHTQSQAGELLIYSMMDATKFAAVREALIKEPELWAKDDYFGEQEFQDVRRGLEIGHKFEINKPSEYIKTLAFWWAITGLDYYGDYLDNLKKIKLDDVRTFVRKYLINTPYNAVVLVSPKDAATASLKDNATPLLSKFFSTPPSAKE